MNIQTYRVRGIDLEHDGERFPEGSTIELTAAQATKLRRFLEPVVSQGDAAKKSATEKAAAEKANAEKAAAEKTEAEKAAAKIVADEKAAADKASTEAAKKDSSSTGGKQ
ncbi:hypothetical protein [Pandoraea norimbergensis]|uniref:Mu-like prophage FluMu N-terminal domain-containing protein n=1 Tax=Pandoraea norimbergensis TaxID=93219 RepID=A0ABN4JLR7_9BURK|nr:hypothetical protein [Pandoraea norimbergensis]ALS61987.1 hypothetical protein AT302_21580 [Pandoraea norimbergensis]